MKGLYGTCVSTLLIVFRGSNNGCPILVHWSQQTFRKQPEKPQEERTCDTSGLTSFASPADSRRLRGEDDEMCSVQGSEME